MQHCGAATAHARRTQNGGGGAAGKPRPAKWRQADEGVGGGAVVPGRSAPFPPRPPKIPTNNPQITQNEHTKKEN